jgi:HNH endonuclease
LPANRPDIPAELERQVFMEAGYMCAIPACQRRPVEIAHIDPWSRVKEHKFENLIALCPTCHTLYDQKVCAGSATPRYGDGSSLPSSHFPRLVAAPWPG